jgi:RNA polymerase sigma factor for flagellar operon FliA
VSTLAPTPGAAPQGPTREQLIVRYAPLARRAVHHFPAPRYGAVDIEDMYGYATLGLIDAVDRYDTERGVKFETYAITRIRGFILDQLRDLDWMPRSTRATVKLVQRTADNLEERLGRKPAPLELSRETGLSEKICSRALADGACFVSSLESITTGSDNQPDSGRSPHALVDEDSPNPAGFFEQYELRRGVATALAALPLREGMVLRMRYVDDLRHREIAGRLGISEARVSQLHARGIARMRQELVETFGDIASTRLTA